VSGRVSIVGDVHAQHRSAGIARARRRPRRRHGGGGPFTYALLLVLVALRSSPLVLVPVRAAIVTSTSACVESDTDALAGPYCVSRFVAIFVVPLEKNPTRPTRKCLS